MNENDLTTPTNTPGQPEPTVTLVGPSDHKDTIYVTEDGPIRLFEGRARVPLWFAKKHVRRGWYIEP